MKTNIGIDYHDTLSYDPKFFQILFSLWKKIGDVYIVTGTPLSKAENVKDELEVLGFGRDSYTDILFGFEYDKNNMTTAHFIRMREHKLSLIKNTILKSCLTIILFTWSIYVITVLLFFKRFLTLTILKGFQKLIRFLLVICSQDNLIF